MAVMNLHVRGGKVIRRQIRDESYREFHIARIRCPSNNTSLSEQMPYFKMNISTRASASQR